MKNLLSLGVVFAFLAAFLFDASGAVAIKLIPSFGPPSYDVSYQSYALSGAVAIKATGTLPVGAPNPNSPTDARLLTQVAAEDLMTTVSAAFHRGVFNPTPPYQNARGGTVYWWIEATAAAGETVSLADVTVVLRSSDSGNILGKMVSFTGTSYAPTAPGIMADGTEVTSGPATQQVKRVIVGVASTSFSVSSAADVQAVRDFIAQAAWSTTATITAKGSSSSLVLAKVMPTLSLTRMGNRFFLDASNNGDPISYEIRRSTNLVSWTSFGIIRAGMTNDLGLVATNPPPFFITYKSGSSGMVVQSHGTTAGGLKIQNNSTTAD